jgi:hypothetical protein
MNQEEENYFQNAYSYMRDIIKYAREEEQKGNLGAISKQIILKTGAPGSLFKVLKFHLFGERDTEIDDIELQHSLR